MAELTPGRISYSYNSKSVNANSRAVVDSWWRDLINRYGVCTQYYQLDYPADGRHELYEEVYSFLPSKPIMAMIEIPNEAWLFSKFGLNGESDFTGVIHIGTWMNTFGAAISAEPKVGDVIRIDNTGWANSEADIHTNTGYASGDGICSLLNNNATTLCESAASALEIAESLTTGNNANGNSLIANITLTVCPSDGDWRRFPQLFQITEKRYQEISMGINTLGGHYVWLLRGKRFQYSHEDGITAENPDAGDNEPGGFVNDDDIIETISDDVFNYDDSTDSDSSIYGDY